MPAPFIVVEGRDVSMFPSLADLTGWVEATDVRDGIYQAFDAQGRVIELAAKSDVSAVTAKAGEPAIERLRSLLIDYVVWVGPERVGVTDPEITTLDLATLVKAIWAFQSRRPRPPA